MRFYRVPYFIRGSTEAVIDKYILKTIILRRFSIDFETGKRSLRELLNSWVCDVEGVGLGAGPGSKQVKTMKLSLAVELEFVTRYTKLKFWNSLHRICVLYRKEIRNPK